MARGFTLQQIRDRITDRTGLGNQPTPALRLAINDAIAWVWPQIIGSVEGYGESNVTVVATPNQETIDYPVSRLQIRALRRPTNGVSDAYLSAEFVTQTAYMHYAGTGFEDDSLINLPGVYWYESPLASLGTPPTPADPLQDLIYLRPVPVVAEQIIILGIETPPILVEDTDIVNVGPGWDRCIVNYATFLLLLSSDAALAERYKALAEEDAQRTVYQWRDKRDSSGSSSIYAYRRSGRARRGRYYNW